MNQSILDILIERKLEGESFLKSRIYNGNNYDVWSEVTLTALEKALGSSNRIVYKFSEIGYSSVSWTGMSAFEAENENRKDLESRLACLESAIIIIKDNLLAPQLNQTKKEAKPSNNKVFIVHGHDETIKAKVERLLLRLELEPIILHTQADLGQTIIEKFSKHSEVSYAIVIATGDDMGRMITAPKEDERPRARQNVILELGYFTAKLGRQNVRLLYQEGVELPNDFSGVLYEQIKATDSWEFNLAREMKAAGLPVDLNKF